MPFPRVELGRGKYLPAARAATGAFRQGISRFNCERLEQVDWWRRKTGAEFHLTAKPEILTELKRNDGPVLDVNFAERRENDRFLSVRVMVKAFQAERSAYHLFCKLVDNEFTSCAGVGIPSSYCFDLRFDCVSAIAQQINSITPTSNAWRSFLSARLSASISAVASTGTADRLCARRKNQCDRGQSISFVSILPRMLDQRAVGCRRLGWLHHRVDRYSKISLQKYCPVRARGRGDREEFMFPRNSRSGRAQWQACKLRGVPRLVVKLQVERL